MFRIGMVVDYFFVFFRSGAILQHVKNQTLKELKK